MSRVTINRVGIENFFARTPLAGVGFAGLKSGSAERLADQMVREAEKNVTGAVVRGRSLRLYTSLQPIVRGSRRGGIEVGVGSTAPYAGHIEKGTGAHAIRPRRRKYLVSAPGHPDPLRGRRRIVNHPGNPPFEPLRKAVNTVIGRGGIF